MSKLLNHLLIRENYLVYTSEMGWYLMHWRSVHLGIQWSSMYCSIGVWRCCHRSSRRTIIICRTTNIFNDTAGVAMTQLRICQFGIAKSLSDNFDLYSLWLLLCLYLIILVYHLGLPLRLCCATFKRKFYHRHHHQRHHRHVVRHHDVTQGIFAFGSVSLRQHVHAH